MTDWNDCPDVERIPGKVSGAWLVKGARLPVDAIRVHADEYTPEEIAAELFQGITPVVARRIIDFAASCPQGNRATITNTQRIRQEYSFCKKSNCSPPLRCCVNADQFRRLSENLRQF